VEREKNEGATLLDGWWLVVAPWKEEAGERFVVCGHSSLRQPAYLGTLT